MTFKIRIQYHVQRAESVNIVEKLDQVFMSENLLQVLEAFQILAINMTNMGFDAFSVLFMSQQRCCYQLKSLSAFVVCVNELFYFFLNFSKILDYTNFFIKFFFLPFLLFCMLQGIKIIFHHFFSGHGFQKIGVTI